MKLALDLARRGGSSVAPNPMVGAVIVKDGKVIGQGYHRFFGGPHAEAEAIRSVKHSADLVGATLYVTLEPCDSFGKQPPCTRAIEKAGIMRVVAGSRDPSMKESRIKNQELRIKGKKQELRMMKGEIAEECERLNKFFFKWVRTKMPYLTAKVAVSADGFMAGEHGKFIRITTTEQDREVHALRASHQAIMVSATTVINDDSHLGVRPRRGPLGGHVPGEDPLRIIIDSHLRSPLSAKVFRNTHTLLVCLGTNPIKQIKRYADLGISVWCAPGRSHVSLKALFRYLGKRGVSSILAEPGPTFYSILKKAGLIDETIAFHGKGKIGKGLRFPE
ncbi:bifunctional diaminohydroxyphosphoribosylaminopyrimidine deaminase/5-amino-6-(5-phosphoribosylamino)uracil reductase RibD [Candidatus Peregrinibacteria bacterium]|nr:bifunctional diaminohydroxyphosphoribosylaminopyrimidine deaminase/5-amino-6-(5-phosphoribosylamino)uracil reductase RibD [Candidatus Peregrinibacteria bacterium]